ncbi:hypothetical protein Kalk_04155 [Ketobacter alkanivorans]|uniref:Glycosyltransferase 2-like domain-containing protein n=1 Tax=Ketobacter alkanivorans TaxID=1917421 RepID=A0A2K9LRS5_9GAMM|nr:hypothetical protein Kalk_04155 [Ketobacter alkanivorans]
MVMPVLNEAAGIERNLDRLFHLLNDQWQVVVVDGGSTDDTLLKLQAFPVKVISSQAGRARQMNAGANSVSGELIVFLHADTQLPDDFMPQMNKFIHSRCMWGRFDVELDDPRWLFKIISWFINQRSWITGVCTGDQALFLRRELFTRLKGYVDIPLMEDVEFTLRARKVTRPYRITAPVLTSARRWIRHGPVKTVLLMWWLRLAFRFGVSPQRLHSWYYGSSR